MTADECQDTLNLDVARSSARRLRSPLRIGRQDTLDLMLDASEHRFRIGQGIDDHDGSRIEPGSDLRGFKVASGAAAGSRRGQKAGADPLAIEQRPVLDPIAGRPDPGRGGLRARCPAPGQIREQAAGRDHPDQRDLLFQQPPAVPW